VVNDFNGAAAQKVVDEIIHGLRCPATSRGPSSDVCKYTDGGKAVVNTSNVTDGNAVINTALDAFGGVTILINNAGILRDKGSVSFSAALSVNAENAPCSFRNMSDSELDQVISVHLKGSFACSKAVWPIFRKQKFGRIINTASAAGLYGAYQDLDRMPVC
jgi:multifunctional beta-oxidation protein